LRVTVVRGKGRFSVERLYAPTSVVVIGPRTPEGARVLANMAQAGFSGTSFVVGEGGFDSVAALPEAPDLAILACAAGEAAAHVHALAARGTRAAIAVGEVDELAGLARDSGVRVLGPHSFGIAVPRLGLNASLSHMAVPQGRVALLTQSASLARAVLDWAGPNGVGFSHIIGVGGNTNMGFGLALDWLSRDPDTGLILVDIRRVRERRVFISAARAASRLRPVVAIRPGSLLMDPSGEADAVFCAALNRAGVIVAHRLDEFLAAAETLSRSKPARAETLAVVTNAIGPGRLAADAALQAGIKLATLPAESQTALAASLPAELMFGLIYATSAAATEVAELAAMVSAVPDVGGVLVLLAPTGPGDGVAVEAVIAAAKVAKLPVLACVMGETTGAPTAGGWRRRACRCSRRRSRRCRRSRFCCVTGGRGLRRVSCRGGGCLRCRRTMMRWRRAWLRRGQREGWSFGRRRRLPSWLDTALRMRWGRLRAGRRGCACSMTTCSGRRWR
jgi:acetyltransferase